MHFSWCDEYRAVDAPNRRIKRAMEKENKQHRDKARKEHNERIRHLVTYVKRRDVRVIAHAKVVKAKQEEAKRKAAEAAAARKAEKARIRAQARARLAEQEEEVLDESVFRLAVEQDQQQRDEAEKEIFACDVCNRYFKVCLWYCLFFTTSPIVFVHCCPSF